MSDGSDEPVSKAGELKSSKIKAEDNPWYLLATLYGVPELGDYDLQKKNRVAWNRYFADGLAEETRARLVSEKRHSAGELMPFSPKELHEVEEAFAQRCKRKITALALPPTDSLPDFKRVEFDQCILFEGYLFQYCRFQDAVFRDLVSFNKATFRVSANFLGTTFCDVAGFAGATFDFHAEFARATFSSRANFDSATFFYVSTFENATFAFANFTDATFFSYANFSNCTFFGLGLFVNAKMKQKTSFAMATFKTKPPEFFGAELHQDTVWRGIIWPPFPKDKEEAGDFIDAYACLKLEMDRLKKHEDELKFFSLELQSLRILQESKFRGSGLPIALYGLVSNYGRSYIRPLIGLFVVAAIGTPMLLLSGAVAPWQSLGLSSANTFNLFGFRKDFFEPAVIARLPAWLDVVGAIQTILGTILLFLVGLGIRNKFRMK